jgi:NAD+ kinase
MSVRTIGVVARPGLAREQIGPVLQDMLAFLRERGVTLLLDRESASVLGAGAPGVVQAAGPELGRAADAIVVLGGDGTLLAASHLIERDGVPLIGVNFGSLGFLTEVTPPELCPLLDRVLGGNYAYEERSLLRAVIRRAGQAETAGDALNDVVVTKAGALSRIVELDVRVDGAFVSAFRADGLIVASPTGSTAYSLAAGGPILHPALAAVVVTTISPHMLTNRPLVLADGATIEVRVATREGEVHATLDGQRGFALAYDDAVTVTRSPRRLRLAIPPARDYFEVLRKKLRWGESNSRRADGRGR